MSFYRQFIIPTIFIAFAGCTESFTPTESGDTTRTTSTGRQIVIVGETTVSDPDPTGGAAAGGTGSGGSSSTTSTPDATGFHATCAGVVDCPDMAQCASWKYEIDDDGTTTVVNASIDIANPGVSCTGQAQYASSQDDGVQVGGVVSFPCDIQVWSLGIDKATELVYVKEMTHAYSWTPPCQ